MVKRIREANHTIVNSGMYRTRALCTRQKFSLYLQTSHGSRKNKIHSGHKPTWRLRFMGVLPMQGRRRRIPQHSRLRPRLQDTNPGPRAGEIGTKEKKHARASCHWPLGPTRQALPTKLRVRPRAAPALFCFFSCSPSPAAPLRREPPKP